MTYGVLRALLATLPARFASTEIAAELRRPAVPWRLRKKSEPAKVDVPWVFTAGEAVALRELARDKGFADPNGTVVEVLLNSAESRLRRRGRRMLSRAYQAHVFPFPALDPDE